MFGVYRIENLINGKSYIGKSTNVEARLAIHKSSLVSDKYTRNTSRVLYSAVRKYGINNFHFGVIEVVQNDGFLLAERELYWIDWYNSSDRNYGYNLQRQSGGVVTHSDETKKLLSNIWKGRKQTPEHILARTSKLIGVKHTEERTDKVRKALLGRKRSKEVTERIGLKLRGRKQTPEHVAARINNRASVNYTPELLASLGEAHSKYSYLQYSDGVLINVFTRVSDLKMSGFDPSSVTAVCNGRSKTHKGFTWEKIPKITM